MKTKKQLIGFLAIPLIVFAIIATGILITACTPKKPQAEAPDFNIYGVWQYTGSADLEHGETWRQEGLDIISIYDDNGNCIITYRNSVYHGQLHRTGDYGFRFNAATRYDLNSLETYNMEGQSPYTFLFNYNPETGQLIEPDHTVENYFEWQQESSASFLMPEMNGYDPVFTPKELAQQVFDLIMQLEGTDDKDPAVSEQLMALYEMAHNMPGSDLRIFSEEVERLYLGDPPPSADFQIVGVSTTSSVMFDELRPFTEYTDDNRGEWLIFTTNTYIEDLWFIEIQHFEDPFSLNVPGALYKCNLSPVLPFLVMTVISSGIPNRGISYVDEKNERRYFYISQDGVDGKYHLTEFQPQSFG
jgi:hypothetical protein